MTDVSPTISLTGSEAITLAVYREVTRKRATVSIDESSLARMDDARSRLLNIAEGANRQPLYGINVGAGDGSFTFLDAAQQRDYARGLNSASSFGRPLPESVIRGILLARLGSFLDGSGGVSSELAVHVAGMLQHEMPAVPAEGTAGSGEILPLGHLFAAVPAELELGPKESMALVNGSPAAAALGADVALWSAPTLQLVTRCAALACDALDAADEHFDAALGDFWGYEEEREVLGTLRALLANPAGSRDAHQARVSVRILPRVLGAALRALRDLDRDATIALAHVGDNPVYIDDHTSPRVASNGGFHNQRILVAVDNFTRSMADLTQLMQHLLHALYQSPAAMPSQDNLSLGISYMVSSDWSEEARAQATPSVLSFSAVGQNDVPFPMFSAWRKAVRVRECVTAQCALLAAMASQSLFSTEREATPALRSFLTEIRSLFEPIDVRRDVGNDLGALARHFEARIADAARDGNDLR